MKGLDHRYSDIDDDFEDRLRAMLRRRAADVRPDPPDWQDLLDRSDAVVVSLHTRRPIADPFGDESRRRWVWLRPAVAAAACLTLVMAAGIAIGRSTDGDGSGGSADQPDGGSASEEDAQTLAAAGSTRFQPATAAPLFPPGTDAQLRAAAEHVDAEVPDSAEQAALDQLGDLADLADPVAVTRDYLASIGIGDGLDASYALWADEPEEPRLDATDGDFVRTTTVWWSLRTSMARHAGTSEPAIYTIGFAHLRDLTSPAETRPRAWVVVGAAVQGLNLAEVRRSGNQLSFAVTPYRSTVADIDTTRLPVSVEVNDRVISEGPLDPEQPREFTAQVPADQAATIRLLQVSGGRPVSVVETKFLPASESGPADANGPNETAPATVAEEVRDGPGTAIFAGCAPELSLSFSLDLPRGFGSTARASGDTGTCAFEFTDAADPTKAITVRWGEPPFPLPELSGPACFKWASTDDGVWVAVRTAPFPIYLTGEGLTREEFEQAVTSSVLSGSSTWSADQGC